MRNIYYLQLESKIRQSFAVTTLSLTPPLSPALWMSWEANEEEGEGKPFIQVWGADRPLGGRQPPAAQWVGGRGPAARQGGGRLPPRTSA